MTTIHEKELIPAWAQRLGAISVVVGTFAVGYGELKSTVKATATDLDGVKVAQAAMVLKVDAIASKADKSDGKLDVIITLLSAKNQIAHAEPPLRTGTSKFVKPAWVAWTESSGSKNSTVSAP